jgi:hypothetical protein
MDPTELLAQLLKVSTRVQRVIDKGGVPTEHDANILAEGIDNLDQWLKAGGDLPEQWKPCFECGTEVAKNGRCIRHGKLTAPRRPAYLPVIDR